MRAQGLAFRLKQALPLHVATAQRLQHHKLMLF